MNYLPRDSSLVSADDGPAKRFDAVKICRKFHWYSLISTEARTFCIRLLKFEIFISEHDLMWKVAPI